MTQRYLSRLNAPPSESARVRVENVLGGVRALLAALALGAFLIDAPAESAGALPVVFFLLGGWLFYSVMVLFLLHARGVSRRGIYILHSLDVAWPAVIMLIARGPSSPFFALFSFSLIAAGFRWGFPETMATAVLGVTMLLVEGAIIKGNYAYYNLVAGQFALHRIVIRSSYLIALGYLIGTLGENEKERRAESAVVARVLRSVRAESPIAFILEIIFAEATRIFAAKRVYLLSHNLETDSIYLWQSSGHSPDTGLPFVAELQLADDQRAQCLAMPEFFFCRRTRAGKTEWFNLQDGVARSVFWGEIPKLPFHPRELNSLLCSSYILGHEWNVRLLLVDANLGSSPDRELSFAARLAPQAISAMYSVYLVRRLRARIGVIERARVSRELHDGITQSLISAEMRLDVIRRGAEHASSPFTSEIAAVQSLLREEVFNLRDLMRQMRPLSIGPEQLTEHMADSVERFSRETGINAKFVCDQSEIRVNPRDCRELMRILQESLVNIRKHARATEVVVSLESEPEGLMLTVSDNGVGFGFSGRIESEELLQSARGPAVIKERVRTIGAEIALVSTPGKGSTLEVRLGQKGPVLHG